MIDVIFYLAFMMAQMRGATMGINSSAGTNPPINAASCSESDVATALGSITTDGQTVVVPSVPSTPCTWTTALTYNATHSFTLQGATMINGTCAAGTSCTATDNTIIIDNYNYTGHGTGFININTVLGKTVRITGFTFRWSSIQTSVTNNGEIQIGGTTQGMTFDHNHIWQPSGATNGIVFMSIWNYILGVADQNLVEATSDDFNYIRVGMPSYNGDSEGLGNKSWASNTAFGTNDFFFVESTTFNWLGDTSNPAAHFAAVNDCNAGGKMVFRYNQVNGLWLTQMHEMEGDYRGCRAFEDYGNNYAGSGSNPFSNAFGSRMGTALVWGNTTTGFSDLGNLTNDRTNTGHAFGAAYPAVATQSLQTGWGYCGTNTGGSGADLPPSIYDFSTGANGSPCADQVGSGKSLLVSGLWPNKLVAGILQWVANALEPLYFWDNIYNAPSVGTNHFVTSSDTSTIQENVSYYLQLPNYDESGSFTGAAGIGQGIYSAIPSTCTPLVAYWATDTNTLYQCATLNTWTVYYRPYTFPHPLAH